MKNVRWSCRETMKFVKVYLKNTCLWDPAHPHYKDTESKLAAFQDIVSCMREVNVHVDMPTVRIKIKNLRCTYLQEVQKILRRSTDSNNKYEPSLPWFREMDRHLKHIVSNNAKKREAKWADQYNNEIFHEEHLDETLMDNNKEVGEVSEENIQNNESSDDISDFIYTDVFGTRWSSEVTIKFVKSYLKHECLWNPKLASYTNKKKKLEAYRNIIMAMNKYVKMDINGVRTKIRNLRSTYSQELLKVMKKSTDPNHIYEPTMPWFKLMDEKLKMVVQLKPKLIKANMKWESEIPWVQSENSSRSIVDEDILQNMKSDMEGCLEDDHQLNHDDTNVNSDFIQSQINKDTFYEDEYDIFGRYIASQLRKLDLKSALHSKADILEILSKARLNTL